MTRPAAAGPAAVGMTVYHRSGDPAAFREWADRLIDAARAHPGFREGGSATPDATELDWSVGIAFGSMSALDAWLDSGDRQRVLAEGRERGVHRAAELAARGTTMPPAGTAVFEHSVEAARTQDFLDSQRRLSQVAAGFPGFQGVAVQPAPDQGDGPDGSTRWISVLRFRTGAQLETWMHSDERARELPGLRSSLGEDFTELTASTPFGSIVRVSDGQARTTPQWKSALLVLLVLYPTVMLLSRFVGPLLADAGAPEWLAMWLSQILSVGLMTYLLMPLVTGRFRRWLDPVDGAGLRITLLGLAAALLVIAICLAVFGTVQWLQFWDYQD
ncbi:antibiotic biosynthesis monooxygenase [Nakamurella sp. YIM 132087]|uniref:Antibiotic biosynthesis monooxygenase n=1 Tax=Nakamurella alba TaxID=2665158 RepID=A0A7K1FMN5_9ACTN|nr:antibiotic biosynthesis monooxygenase [Nakamurella alba]MTD14579.1 antibiotic biosynthesis monooxygenase [Nakamurella alba]